MAAGRETTLIVGDRYTSRSAFTYDEPVTGAWLRYCRAGARTRTVSVHWSCPPAASRFTPRPVTSSSTRRARPWAPDEQRPMPAYVLMRSGAYG